MRRAGKARCAVPVKRLPRLARAAASSCPRFADVVPWLIARALADRRRSLVAALPLVALVLDASRGHHRQEHAATRHRAASRSSRHGHDPMVRSLRTGAARRRSRDGSPASASGSARSGRLRPNSLVASAGLHPTGGDYTSAPERREARRVRVDPRSVLLDSSKGSSGRPSGQRLNPLRCAGCNAVCVTPLLRALFRGECPPRVLARSSMTWPRRSLTRRELTARCATRSARWLERVRAQRAVAEARLSALLAGPR